MSIAAVIGRGLGPDPSIAGVVLRGYSIGAPQPVAQTLVTRGFNGRVSSLIHRGFSAYVGLPEPPITGKQYADCTSTTTTGYSLLDSLSPAGAVADVFITDQVTNLTAYLITVNGNGTLIVDAGGDTTRQTFQADVFDQSLLANFGVFNVYINNHAPSLLSQPPNILQLRNSPLSVTYVPTYVTDQDGDPVTSSITSGSLATGLAYANNVLSGTPTVAIDNLLTIRFTDILSDFLDVTFRLTVDVGATVPDLSGKTLIQDQAALAAVGLSLAAVPTFAYSSTVPTGQTISQSPVAGAFVFTGSTVDVLLSLGPVPTTSVLTMPDLVGVSFYQGLEVLQFMGIYEPAVAYNFGPSTISVLLGRSAAVRAGFIYAQSIPVGATVTAGVPITLSIATPPFGMAIDMPPDWRQHS